MTQSNRNRLFIIYLVAIHCFTAALIYTLYFNPTKDQWNKRLHSFYSRVDANVEPGAYLFLGDSHVQGLCTSCVIDQAVNYGIGKDTLVGVHRRLKDYSSKDRAKAIILQAGHNDLKSVTDAEIQARFSTLIQSMPKPLNVVVTAQFPVGIAVQNAAKINIRKQEINKVMAQACISTARCTMLDLTQTLTDQAGFLAPKNHLGDGVHLSKIGYDIWIHALKKTLIKTDS